MNTTTIPLKQKRFKRDVHIRLLYKLGFSMNEIVKELSTPENKISKHTVFRAVHKGRPKEINTK